MKKSLIQILLTVLGPLAFAACGPKTFQSKLEPTNQRLGTEDFVGIPSHDPPQTLAYGGSLQIIQQHHTNEAHIEVGVESVVGKAILHKPQQKGQYQIETGYTNMQGWWGTAHD